MEHEYELIVARLMLALLAGGIIGLERALHGREAGFRTHALVCVSSSLLMVLMVFQWELIPEQFLQTVRADPSRMAQGIMTGIGFLGAGVILKEGSSVRGLTTAASIWITASIGIAIGAGLYFAALCATTVTLVTLSVFRWVENLLPTQRYARFKIRLLRDKTIDERALRQLVENHRIRAFDSSYRMIADGKYFEYEMIIRSKDRGSFSRLTESLAAKEEVCEFSITPSR